jgi:hypothetical protein
MIVDITVGMTANCEYNNEKKDSDCDKGSEDSVADMTGQANNALNTKWTVVTQERKWGQARMNNTMTLGMAGMKKTVNKNVAVRSENKESEYDLLLCP